MENYHKNDLKILLFDTLSLAKLEVIGVITGWTLLQSALFSYREINLDQIILIFIISDLGILYLMQF